MQPGSWPASRSSWRTSRRMPEEKVSTIEVRELGRVAYGEALNLQTELVTRRRLGEIPDQLLLLEHPHVITVGTSSATDHILLSDEERTGSGDRALRSGPGGGCHLPWARSVGGLSHPLLDSRPKGSPPVPEGPGGSPDSGRWPSSGFPPVGKKDTPVSGPRRGRWRPSASGFPRDGSPRTDSP